MSKPEARKPSPRKIRDIDCAPTDRVALNQGRELDRRKRVIRKVWLRLMATVFASSANRYMELVDEAKKIIAKEVALLYELDHPKKTRRQR